jgi:hypothetical protein
MMRMRAQAAQYLSYVIEDLFAGGVNRPTADIAEANALLDHLLALRNDLGLLSEEYDTSARLQVGGAYAPLIIPMSAPSNLLDDS